MKQRQKRTLGVFFWAVTLVGGCAVSWAILRGHAGESTATARSAAEIVRYLTRQSEHIIREDPLGRLRPGDPVFLADEQAGESGAIGESGATGDSGGGFRQVGRVLRRVPQEVGAAGGQSGRAHAVEILWYDSTIAAEECQLFQYHSSGKLSEVVETLMPPETQRRIRERLAATMAAHGEELSQALVPLVEESLRKSLPLIEAEFRRSMARHRDEIDQAAERFNHELVQQRLLPMARKEILPIVKRHGQPPVEAIGREIWDRASLFRFGWRALYDKSPLPRRDLLREEWARFVDDEAVPVLERHMDEVVVAIQRSLSEIARNEAVRSELAAVAEEVAHDPQSRALVKTVLKETFVENQELRTVWKEVWTSDEARRALQVTGDRLEPVVRQIGDDLFGSEAEGIDPNFARVLRSQILRKDRRWVVAWHTGSGNNVIENASRSMPYPIVYLAEE